MRKAKFEHVSLRTEKRSDNGKPNYILTWFPMPKHRMRKTFSDEGLAKFEADRIERLMANGYAGMTKLPTPEMVLFIMQCEQMQVQPHTVMQFYLAHHAANGSSEKILVKAAANNNDNEATERP